MSLKKMGRKNAMEPHQALNTEAPYNPYIQNLNAWFRTDKAEVKRAVFIMSFIPLDELITWYKEHDTKDLYTSKSENKHDKNYY